MVVPLEALEPFLFIFKQVPEVLPYLQFNGRKTVQLNSVELQTPDGISHKIVQSNYKYMYWNMTQQLAHQRATVVMLR